MQLLGKRKFNHYRPFARMYQPQTDQVQATRSTSWARMSRADLWEAGHQEGIPGLLACKLEPAVPRGQADPCGKSAEQSLQLAVINNAVVIR